MQRDAETTAIATERVLGVGIAMMDPAEAGGVAVAAVATEIDDAIGMIASPMTALARTEIDNRETTIGAATRTEMTISMGSLDSVGRALLALRRFTPPRTLSWGGLMTTPASIRRE